MARVLLVEDDYQLGEVVKAFLELNDFDVVLCESGEEALKHGQEGGFSCVVLDLNLPDEDGLVILRKLRHINQTPVIICSARGSSDERILGFEFGARDYMPKPYSPKELCLRINNIIELTTPQVEAKKVNEASHKLWIIDDERKGVVNALTQDFVPLTHSEFLLFQTLSTHEGKVYTRAELIDAISRLDGPDYDRAIDVCISRLRKKIETNPSKPSVVVTNRGFGYHLNNRIPRKIDLAG